MLLYIHIEDGISKKHVLLQTFIHLQLCFTITMHIQRVKIAKNCVIQLKIFANTDAFSIS